MTSATTQILDDVIGRLRNTRLPKSKALLPVFEAVINSIQSLDEVERLGRIDIKIIRSPQKEMDEDILPPIIEFQISDDGPGFNEANFNSFCTADSRFKERMGGKGIGRFIWLKAFEAVNIESTYVENGQIYRRSFMFRASEPPIQNHKVEEVESGSPVKTCVALGRLRSDYSDVLPSKAETIAARLVRHLLIYLLDPHCPEIVVHDDFTSRALNLNNHFRNELIQSSEQQTIVVDGRMIDVRFVKIIAAPPIEHSIALCADKREVCTYPLHKALPNSRSVALENPEGGRLELRVIVGGEYLDSIVSLERTNFLFADTDEIGSDKFDLTLEQLLTEIGVLVRAEIRDTLDELEKRKLERIRAFVREQEPEYRVLLKHASDEIAKIPPDIPDSRLDQELHRILHNVELQIKEEGREFIGVDVSAIENLDEYKERYRQYVDKLLDYRSSELAKYVIHRRTIIELLGKAISLSSSGKYALEEDVHRILYPPRFSSDDLEFGHQNLWLIDEKLTYHYYLASDTAFSRMQIVDSNSVNRPDVLVFDQPSAFTEGEYPLQSIVIIELKRPERNDYSADSKNPFEQVYTYIDDLKAGRVLGPDGQHVQLNSNTRFYCYILADITPSFRQLARRNEFFDTPDELGFYKFSRNYNAYIEVVSYRKLFEDAKKRNRVLFEKLALPGYEHEGV